MTTIAQLKIVVDTSQVDKATESLKKFGSLSGDVSKSTNDMSKGMEDASSASEQYNKAQQRLIDRAREMSETVGKGAAGVLDYKASLAGVSSEVGEYTNKTRELVESQKLQAQIDKEILRSKQEVSLQQYKLLEGIREETALLGLSKEEQRAYRAAQLGISEQYQNQIQLLEGKKKAMADLQAVVGTDSEDEVRNTNEKIAALQEEIKTSSESISQEKLRAQIAAEGADAARQHIAAMEAKVAAQKEEVASLQQSRSAIVQGVQSQERLVEATKAVNVENRKAAEEFMKLRHQIDPASKALDALEDRALKAAKALKDAQRGVGGIDVDEATRVLKKAESDLAHFQKMSDTTGKTVKELNFAMRGLPAQFTDIAVSLQGGQRPMTVFLQQGGQLKDMFGGIGPAAKAMGSYILALVTPLNLAIAAIGGIGFAMYSGSRDMEKMNKMIIQSGKIATISSREILYYSNSVSEMSHTVGQSIEAISLFVNEMDLTDETLVKASAAALSWSKITGDSIADVVKDFGKLSKDPVKSIVELDSKYNFLTASIYKSIKALQEAGNEMEATEMATNALAQSISDKSELMYERLGLIAKGWHNVKAAATGVFDYFADMGRSGDEELLGVLEERLNKATEARDRLMMGAGGEMPINQYQLSKLNDEIENTTNKIEALGREMNISEGAELKNATIELGNAVDASRTKLEKATLAILTFKEATKEGSLFNAEDLAAYNKELAKLERARDEARDEAQGLRLLESQRKVTQELQHQATYGKSMGAQQKAYNDLVEELEAISSRVAAGSATEAELAKHNARDALLAGAKENLQLEKQIELQKETKKQAKEVSKVKVEASERLIQNLKAQEESLRDQLLSNTKLGREENRLSKLRRQISEIEEQGKKRILSLNEKSLLSNKDAILAQQQKNVELEKEIRLKQQSEKIDEMRDKFSQDLTEGNDRARELQQGHGRGDQANERQRERNELIRDEARALLEAKKAAQGDEEYYQKQAAVISKYYEDRKTQLEDYYALERELQTDWVAGMSSGFETFLENQLDIYTSMKELTEETLESMASGVADNFTKAIMYGEDLNELMTNMALTITEEVLGSLIELGAQYAINAVKEVAAAQMVGAAKQAVITTTAATAATATATTTATQVSAGAATAAAWSPAALAASVGSFGTAAIIGLAAVVAIMAAFGGFKKGGYTGNGGVDDVAGFVHGKEYVFDAASTARIGVSNLEAIRRGESLGGGGGGSRGGQVTLGGGGNTVNQVIQVQGQVDGNTANQIAIKTARRQKMAESRFG